jgi:hypothetical protein
MLAATEAISVGQPAIATGYGLVTAENGRINRTYNFFG